VEADRELLDRRRVEGGREREPLLGVGGEGEAALPQLPQPLRAEPREVDEPAEGEERLVRRDVGGRLLAADVLLTCLEREDEAAAAVEVGRLADDAPRHPADELLL